MSKLSDYNAGDRVYHTSRKQYGWVREVDDATVKVAFDKRAPSGGPSVGIYDAAWFRRSGDLLTKPGVDWEQRARDAYQIVGWLLNRCDLFNTPDGERVLDYLSGKEIEGDILPWPRDADAKEPE